jgi:hypothetical protein
VFKRVSREALDLLLGEEGYKPGLIDAFALTLLFVLFAIAFDNPPW